MPEINNDVFDAVYAPNLDYAAEQEQRESRLEEVKHALRNRHLNSDERMWAHRPKKDFVATSRGDTERSFNTLPVGDLLEQYLPS